MVVVETTRLTLRRLTLEDARFILGLLNEPSFLELIGDKGVRTLDDARRYLETGPLASYERHGFGLYLVELKETSAPIGICGLIQRDSLDDVDIGFAFTPENWSRGYAFESASAVLDFGFDVLGLERIVAITSRDNEPSIKVLERLGLRFEKELRLAADEEPVKLFGSVPRSQA